MMNTEQNDHIGNLYDDSFYRLRKITEFYSENKNLLNLVSEDSISEYFAHFGRKAKVGSYSNKLGELNDLWIYKPEIKDELADRMAFFTPTELGKDGTVAISLIQLSEIHHVKLFIFLNKIPHVSETSETDDLVFYCFLRHAFVNFQDYVDFLDKYKDFRFLKIYEKQKKVGFSHDLPFGQSEAE